MAARPLPDPISCGSCRTLIIFAFTVKKGQRSESAMPFNITPDPSAEWRFEPIMGSRTPLAVHVAQDELFAPADDTRYMPHWENCTEPERWRKPR